MTKKFSKKSVISAVAVLAAISLTVVGVMAFFTDREQANTSAEAAKLDVTILGGLVVSGNTDIVPGDNVPVGYGIKNEGTVDAKVRQKLVVSVTDKDGDPIKLNTTTPEFQIYDADDIEETADGYKPKTGKTPIGTVITSGDAAVADNSIVYLTDEETIAKNATSTKMLGVVFGYWADNQFQECNVALDVVVEARQAKYDGDENSWTTLETKTVNLTGMDGKSVKAAPARTEFTAN